MFTFQRRISVKSSYQYVSACTYYLYANKLYSLSFWNPYIWFADIIAVLKLLPFKMVYDFLPVDL